METAELLEGGTKKQLIEWLQANASNSFLEKNTLRGKADRVAAKKNRQDLVKLCKQVLGDPSLKRNSQDEKETKDFKDTFCRQKIRKVPSLKTLTMRAILARLDHHAPQLHSKMPDVRFLYTPPFIPTIMWTKKQLGFMGASFSRTDPQGSHNHI